jgi:steroid 5-alpha reductase family enzyme
MDANATRGMLSNGIGILILASVSWNMDLTLFAVLALAINWVVFFAQALPNNSEKFFDATGSLTYLCLAAVSVGFSYSGREMRQLVNPAMMTVWCVRLGSFLLSRILRDGKDSRFDELKKHWLRFLGIWTIQALWCFLVASPVLVCVTSKSCATEPGLLDFAGWCVWVFGFAFEVIADQQKNAFRTNADNKGRFITTGLWSLSRHPNYFGEITMWVGICLSSSSCLQGANWMAWLSPLTTFILLMKVSGVPLLEATGEERWGKDPAYQWYMKHTPCIVPALRAPPAYKPSAAPLLNEKQ